MALSNTAVNNAKAREKLYRITDGQGMYLLVKPSSKRYWRLDYIRYGYRKVAYIRYVLEACVEEKSEQIQREETGCFVLLTSIPQQGNMAETCAELLQIYKEQYGITQNFSFLNDPLIVNDLFLNYSLEFHHCFHRHDGVRLCSAILFFDITYCCFSGTKPLFFADAA